MMLKIFKGYYKRNGNGVISEEYLFTEELN